jgi:hypothetical protein
MQFNTEQEVVDYVDREIKLALPAGWTAIRERSRAFVWHLIHGNSGPPGDYILRVSGDCKLFLIEHSNSDAGSLSLHHALLNAKVIDSDALDHFALSVAIAEVIRRCEPNQWGLT